MNVAYIFRNNMASTFQLATMILPQLEKGNHGANVLGMFFFDDNLFVLREGDPVGERLASVASERGILLMMCDECAVRRNMAIGTLEECGSGQVKASGTVNGVYAGCFPQLYEALSGSTLDQVITL